MFLDLGENRPDTPRVPSTFTRLERVLIAVVAYQALLVSYLIAPNSFWAQPVKELLNNEPIRYVSIEPLVDRSAVPKKTAPPSDMDRRSTTPQPVPQARNEDPLTRGQNFDRAQPLPDQPAQSSAQQRAATGPAPNEAPPQPRVPGGILGSAMKSLARIVGQQGADNPQGGGADQGADIQFDSKGVDFGPWIRRFRAQVISNWLIPQAAYIIHGRVVIQLAVHRDGTLTNIHLISGSGNDALDSAAMSALKLSNPTMKLPDNYPGDVIDPFTVTFYYLARTP